MPRFYVVFIIQTRSVPTRGFLSAFFHILLFADRAAAVLLYRRQCAMYADDKPALLRLRGDGIRRPVAASLPGYGDIVYHDGEDRKPGTPSGAIVAGYHHERRGAVLL